MEDKNAKLIIEVKTTAIDPEAYSIAYEPIENTMQGTGPEIVLLTTLAITRAIESMMKLNEQMTKEDAKDMLLDLIEKN